MSKFGVVLSKEQVKELIMEYAREDGLKPTGEYHICDDGSAWITLEDEDDKT